MPLPLQRKSDLRFSQTNALVDPNWAVEVEASTTFG